MNSPVRHDPDSAFEAFFETGPRHLPEALAAAIRDEVHHTRQRRGLPRWEGNMNRFAIPAAGLGVVAAIVLAFTIFTSGPSGNVGPGGSATPHSSPSSASSPASSAEILAPLGYRGSGTIAFTRSDPSGGGDTSWFISPDGSGATQVVVTAQDGSDGREHPTCCLVFSPDGTQVAVGYQRAEGDGPCCAGLMETRILTVGGNDVRWLPNCGACAMVEGLNYVPRAWSPDGSLIALEVWSDGDPTRNGMNLVLVNDLGWAEQVGGNHDDVPVAFSPDGTRLLFVRLTGDESGTLMELTIPDLADACCDYQRMGIRGSTRRVGAPGMLTTIDRYFGAPASWSPDGKQIAFAATDPSLTGGRMRIWVVDADGGEPAPLTSDASIYTGAAWSPDGRWIAFDRVAADGHTHDAYVMRPDGSGATNLTGSFAPGVCCARWSPDSSAMLVAGTTGANRESYLFIVPIDGSPIAQVTTEPGFYQDFSWGPVSR
jgi:WD40 repeat protein